MWENREEGPVNFGGVKGQAEVKPAQGPCTLLESDRGSAALPHPADWSLGVKITYW